MSISPGHGGEGHRKQKPPVIVKLLGEHGHQQPNQHPIVPVESRGDSGPGVKQGYSAFEFHGPSLRGLREKSQFI